MLVIIKKQYGSFIIGNRYLTCWIKTNDWKLGISIYMFQYIGLILHCCIIVYSCCVKRKYGNIMKNYFRFIVIYVILWIPAMIYGILTLIIGSARIPFGMIVLTISFMLSTGLANGIIWCTNKGTYETPTKLIINNESPTILNKNENRIGINSSKIVTNTFNALSGINIESNMNTETVTSSLPLDYDPASKIGPRSMYNGDDDTPTMMLIDNTVNEYKYDITSENVTKDDQQETGSL